MSRVVRKASGWIGLLVVASVTTGAADPPSPTSIRVDLEAPAFKEGDQFNAAKKDSASSLMKADGGFSKVEADAEGVAWTATVAPAEQSFESPFLKFEVPTGTPITGRLEAFEPAKFDGITSGTFILQFDYMRLTEGGGLIIRQFGLVNSSGLPMAPVGAIYLDASVWKTDVPFTVGTAYRLRMEYELRADQPTLYSYYINGQLIDKGESDVGGPVGGFQIQLSDQSLPQPAAFGLDNMEVQYRPAGGATTKP